MLKRINILSVFMVLFFNALVLAHGSGEHITGTVMALEAEHIVVKTREGKTISIQLNTETRYRIYRHGEAAAADLKVGDRIVVEATGEGDTLTASEIQFVPASEKQAHEGEPHRH